VNIRNASEAGGRIHEANCDIWQVPDQNGSDALIDAGYQDDAFIAYLSAVSPIYPDLFIKTAGSRVSGD